MQILHLSILTMLVRSCTVTSTAAAHRQLHMQTVGLSFLMHNCARPIHFFTACFRSCSLLTSLSSVYFFYNKRQQQTVFKRITPTRIPLIHRMMAVMLADPWSTRRPSKGPRDATSLIMFNFLLLSTSGFPNIRMIVC